MRCDNLRRYRAIREALTQCYPGEISGRMCQHLTTLAAFISGIVGSKSSQLPQIAAKIPDRAKPESRVKRISRWLGNEHIKEEVYFLPYAELLLTQIIHQPAKSTGEVDFVVQMSDNSTVSRWMRLLNLSCQVVLTPSTSVG